MTYVKISINTVEFTFNFNANSFSKQISALKKDSANSQKELEMIQVNLHKAKLANEGLNYIHADIYCLQEQYMFKDRINYIPKIPECILQKRG